MSNRIEVQSFELQEKTLPGWLRGGGFRIFVNTHLRHWQGPEFPGFRNVFAFTFHYGPSMESDGMTFWFFLPDGQEETLGMERLQEAATYMFQRIDRKAHQPKRGFTSYVFPQLAPANN